jgi:hypothetical protein
LTESPRFQPDAFGNRKQVGKGPGFPDFRQASGQHFRGTS